MAAEVPVFSSVCMCFNRLSIDFCSDQRGDDILDKITLICGFILHQEKGKTAVILQDSLDVNKEALAKVCKCHDI